VTVFGLPLEEAVKIVSAVLQASAIVVTAYFASRGLNAWRQQLLGKRRFEVAEEMLLAAYKAQSVMAHVRNPMTFGEGQIRPRAKDERPGNADAKDMYFAPLARMQKLDDDFAQWSKVKYLAETYFGPGASAPFHAIRRSFQTVAVAARMLVETVGELAPSDPRKKQWEAEIWDTRQPDDPITASVAAAVRDVETICRPHLRDKATGRRK
jgi:hypothetical protein